MDLKAKHLSDKCSDPIEFLNQLRQTTKPIGGGTEYSDDGELVEYEVAVIAIDKMTNALIEKACEWLLNHNDYLENPYVNVTSFNMAKLVADFRKAMKGE